jgi:hypothetical protein
MLVPTVVELTGTVDASVEKSQKVPTTENHHLKEQANCTFLLIIHLTVFQANFYTRDLRLQPLLK